MNLLYGLKNEVYKTVLEYDNYAACRDRFNLKYIVLPVLRNQEAAFQVLLKSDEDFLLNVSPSTSFDKRGHVDAIRLDIVFDGVREIIPSGMNIIGFIEDDDRLYKSDILLNQDCLLVESGRIQPVWVGFDIPESLVAGEYCGKVVLYRHKAFEGEIIFGELGFKLEVKDVTLPKPSEYSFYLDLWQHNSNIARKHEVPLWSDAHFEVMEKYVSSLANLGQKAVTVIASEIPWSGQFCYRDASYRSNLFEYSMIRVDKDITGTWVIDFSVMDRYIDLCFKYGIDSEIEIFGLINIWMCEEEGFGRVIKDFFDGIRVRYLDRSDNCFKYIDTIEDITSYILSIERHFLDSGLIDRVRVVADEPANAQLYFERLNFLKRTAPSFKYKAAINYAGFIKENIESIKDYVPIFDAVCKEFYSIRELKSAIDGRICWYVCCQPPIPNTFIRSNLLESHVIGWLTEYMGLDGFLRWNYTAWPENPRERISFRYPYWSAGDTNFVYPSNNGGPLLSLRYKALLKGIQAFELLRLLKKSNPLAEEIIIGAFGKIFHFQDITEFLSDSGKKIEDLISLNYDDYLKALEVVLSGL
jgi:hypothetical protein